MDFNTANEKSKEYELKLVELLNIRDYIQSPSNKQFKEFDIMTFTRNDVISYEIKVDFRARQTGNFFMEISCSGNDSGIYSTKADYYAIFTPLMKQTNLYIIPVSELKRIKDKYAIKLKCVKGGDGNRSQGLLLPIRRYLKEYLYITF